MKARSVRPVRANAIPRAPRSPTTIVTSAMTVRGQPASQLKVEAIGTTRPRAVIAMVAGNG